MAATHRLDERLFTLLVGYIALFSALVLEMSGGGRLRWALYAVFAPLVAAALLPFKLTLAIGVLSAVAAGIVSTRSTLTISSWPQSWGHGRPSASTTPASIPVNAKRP